MRNDLPVRLVVITLLCAVLVGMFIAYDANVFRDDPFNDEDDLGADPEAIVTEQIELSGVVIGTDPVRIEVEYETGILVVTVENAPAVEIGQQLTLVGTVKDATTVVADADRSFTREPWERQYMYVVSLVGAALVAVRLVNEWRFDPRTLTFAPRSHPLLSTINGDEN